MEDVSVLQAIFLRENNLRHLSSKLADPAKNKVDSFDTRVSETINLFLFAKMLAAQGFSAKRHFGIVSLWALCRCFAPLQLSILCQRQSPLRHKSAEKGLKSRASEVNC